MDNDTQWVRGSEILDELVEELKHPTLIFGNWTVDLERCTLAHKCGYWVDLEEMTTSAATLDWICQVSQKTWLTPQDLADFMAAINRHVDPQACLCSFGVERGPVPFAPRRNA